MEEFASDAQIQKLRRKPLTTATPFGFLESIALSGGACYRGETCRTSIG